MTRNLLEQEECLLFGFQPLAVVDKKSILTPVGPKDFSSVKPGNFSPLGAADFSAVGSENILYVVVEDFSFVKPVGAHRFLTCGGTQTFQL